MINLNKNVAKAAFMTIVGAAYTLTSAYQLSHNAREMRHAARRFKDLSTVKLMTQDHDEEINSAN